MYQTILSITLLSALPAFAAAAPDYLGAWKISRSEIAPWASPNDTLGLKDEQVLIGKEIVFERNRIIAPVDYLGCARPHYEMKNYPANFLFQGGLTNPDTQASNLGFHPPGIKTLETGCAFEFHFIDETTAMFALDNRLYRIERIRP